jgi:hypothetical protein
VRIKVANSCGDMISTVTGIHILADIEAVEANANGAPKFKRYKVWHNASMHSVCDVWFLQLSADTELSRLHALSVNDIVGYKCFLGQVWW